MKINRREAIRAALIGIPGLVLLPKAVQAIQAEEVVLGHCVGRGRHIRGNVKLMRGQHLLNCTVTGSVLLAEDDTSVIGCTVGHKIFVHPGVTSISVIGNISKGKYHGIHEAREL